MAQLKESIRLNLPEIIFLCETKQTRGFVGSVCKKLRYGSRWETSEPVGKKRGMLVAWNQNVEIIQVLKTGFSLEL